MRSVPANDAPFRLIDSVEFGEGVVVLSFTNLYGCRVGDETRIGPFVEIQRGAELGRRCKVQSHTFVCDAVSIGDGVFIGHGVMFVNDKYPRATTDDGELAREGDWELLPIRVEHGATIGSGRDRPRRRAHRARCARRGGGGVTRDVPDGALRGGWSATAPGHEMLALRRG